MTKIRIEEINHCWACPDCVTYDLTEMACGCIGRLKTWVSPIEGP